LKRNPEPFVNTQCRFAREFLLELEQVRARMGKKSVRPSKAALLRKVAELGLAELAQQFPVGGN